MLIKSAEYQWIAPEFPYMCPAAAALHLAGALHELELAD